MARIERRTCGTLHTSHSTAHGAKVVSPLDYTGRLGHWLWLVLCVPLNALTLMVGWQEGHPAHNKPFHESPEVHLHRVPTNLENLQLSGNFVNLEKSGKSQNLRCGQGIFYDMSHGSRLA